MEWLIRLAESAIQASPNYALVWGLYKGLKTVLAPFKPLYNVWIQEKEKDLKLKEEAHRIQNNKLALLQFAADLAQNVKGDFPEAVSNHCKNILAIAQFTQKFLDDKEDYTKEDIETEWIERFYNEAQYVSDEKMQELWGRLMKEKIYRPSKVNKRLLSIIKDMDASELDYIGNNMKYFVSGCVPATLAQNIPEFNSDILRLAAFGLVLPLQVENSISFEQDPPDCTYTLEAKGYTFSFSPTGDIKVLSYDCYMLTPEGEVLYNLVQDKMDEQTATQYTDFFNSISRNSFRIEAKKV
ncbi:MAG: DUF2806 domain-containing protein [Prevotella sp.]|nr:DUF2806 domain-containing protein [Prevotella sp.]